MTISVIGNGFVGGAVANGFKHRDPFIYDIDSKRSNCSLQKALKSNYIFICLPTPMTHVDGGRANLSILYNFFDSIKTVNVSGIFILKSTVPIGTTNDLKRRFSKFKFVHNPEFLTAANANHDFLNADRTVIGGDLELVNAVGNLYQNDFPNIPIIKMTSDESETVKYTANCFLATKVMFFNEIKLLTEKLGIDYNRVIDGVSADVRIGRAHTRVPGPDGDYGFGGTCFPKDINALISIIDDLGDASHVKSDIFKAVWKRNKEIRTDWDWATSKSSVLEEEK
jgi:UDPglucose 6-dehydrogenase